MVRTRNIIRRLVGASVAIALLQVVVASAGAVVIGSNLSVDANDSVCKFKSLEPETQFCTVGQVDLDVGHTAAGGLGSPFDGVIVQWSVRTGAYLPGTGAIKLALRTMPPGYLERGPEVELPPSPPGSRHVFPERLPVSAGQLIAVRASISNRSTQEAGVPIAFREEGVGKIDTWDGEQLESIWTGWEEDVELLLDAEVEPDGDRDGYGDLTQDCSPGEVGSTQSCDANPPAIRFRFESRQPFLRSGTVVVGVSLNEAGVARAAGQFGIKGVHRRVIHHLRGDTQPVAADSWATLRLRIRKPALKAARRAACDGKKVVVSVRMRAADEQENVRQEAIQVRTKPKVTPSTACPVLSDR